MVVGKGFIFFCKWLNLSTSQWLYWQDRTLIPHWWNASGAWKPQGQPWLNPYFLCMPSSFLISTTIVAIHQINDNISWTNGHCLLLLLSLIGLNIKGSLLRSRLKKVREGVLIRGISDPFTIFLSPFEFKQWQNLSFWVYISSVFSYFSSVTQACLTLCDPMDWGQGFLSITNSRNLLKLMSIRSVMPSNQLILCCPLLLLPSIFPSIRVFSNESVLHIRCPKYWSISFSISPSNEYSELISFRIDWFDLIAVQGTLKSLLQHHSSKASILQQSSFFTVQLSHPYVTTGITTALTRQAFVSKVMSLLY